MRSTIYLQNFDWNSKKAISWYGKIGNFIFFLPQLTPTYLKYKFYILYPIDPFQDHMTWILYYLPNWLISRPLDLILSMCTQLTSFKTIWPNFIIVYPIDSFQDHMTWFLHCIPKWLFSWPFDLILSRCTHLTPSRPFDLILSLCTQLTPFKTIWPHFSIVYPSDYFHDHLT